MNPPEATGKPGPKARIWINALYSALVAAKNLYPKEFVGLYDGHTDENGAICLHELIIAPLSTYDYHSSAFQDWLVPISMDTQATIHSHPSGNPTPSKQDLEFFSRRGRLHLITGSPFTPQTTRAYDREGNRVAVEIYEQKCRKKTE